jgi:hypothetical protein
MEVACAASESFFVRNRGNVKRFPHTKMWVGALADLATRNPSRRKALEIVAQATTKRIQACYAQFIRTPLFLIHIYFFIKNCK